ncbi:MAG TPA: indole-3-glycerol phosphate synthase TrpC [Dehalococcoidia bacterium]|nr:indole-3-glycerol phosphate synthase TrpC [Dehalococcoidia bacterium]
MTNNKILDNIIATTYRSLAQRKRQKPLNELKQEISQKSKPKDLEDCLRGEEIKLIAEIKRASPSKGALHPDLNIIKSAQSYAQGGAAAISVLTEPTFFLGSFADLGIVRKATNLPILCKDFILDTYQIYEARAYGADAILIIAAILQQQELKSLATLAHDLDMSALIEVHDETDIEKALDAEACLIGINNRNLADFSVNLETTLRLRPLIPEHATVVSESGIQSAADIARLKAAGINAILVGEALVTSPDPVAKIKQLLGLIPVRQGNFNGKS